MQTPVYDFVQNYINQKSRRLHMPGHKGKCFLGCEPFDLTEIDGADYLYSANGIIKESEQNATALFSSFATFYSTEGSSHCIKAMLKLALDRFRKKHPSERPVIVASRNVHKAFIHAAALLDFDIEWIKTAGAFNLLRADIDANSLESAIKKCPHLPFAVYITSPDYLGNIADIPRICAVCKANGVPLLVDNAHGAYLRFLLESLHPINNGAFMCCDSAHKTLPVLTGGAYLHLSHAAKELLPRVKGDMEMFASTSPSFLTLQSLDLANRYLNDGYKEKLVQFIEKINALKFELKNHGWDIPDCDPLRLTIKPKSMGYTGKRLAEIFKNNNAFVEFFDPDYLVIMLTCESSNEDLEFIKNLLLSLEKLPPIEPTAFDTPTRLKTLTVREAFNRDSETVSTDKAVGRICASASVGCPPAISVVCAGEIIDQNAIDIMKYYGIDHIEVVI